MIESELLSIKIFLVKVTVKNGQKKRFMIDSVLKANHRTYKIKDLNRETIIGSFYEKQLLWANYK